MPGTFVAKGAEPGTGPVAVVTCGSENNDLHCTDVEIGETEAELNNVGGTSGGTLIGVFATRCTVAKLMFLTGCE